MDWNLWISCFLMFCMTGMKALDIHQPLSMINTARTSIVLDPFVSISAAPDLLGLQGQHVDFVTITFKRPYRAAATDWIGVFSPAIFNSSVCVQDKTVPNRDFYPLLCTAPIKYQYANFSSPGYVEDCEGSMKFRLINQRADFAFALFSGDIYQPVLLAVSNIITFAYRKFPAYPRLALGKLWNEVTITWTSGYDLLEATPLVVWGRQLKKDEFMSGAGTLSFTESDMCGPPARTVGWRNPGYIHTSYLKNLWANTKYFYRVGHLLQNESYVWGTEQFFSSPPYPGEDSVQRVLIFGDMGKVSL
ncbi:hypothetical protein O6H91_02G098000 [Diphasiastrum complanatum]|uniref:Uncharacterized protein n=1 Tax=Diphasiastrum complanatum TaxID=34168 RepID=A0ACC2EIW2_DIPCM|nr:hypothetical protein O6H91_02G098000 [Diphasiastrum complanatum]